MEPKNSKKLIRAAKIGAIAAGCITLLSFFVSLVPCTGKGLCKLPNPLTKLTQTGADYYGISDNPITGLLLQFLVPGLIIAMAILIAKRKPKRVLDLTRK